jgi:hypothetical protein
MIRVRLTREQNPTYKLDALDRDIVGTLQLMQLWSNTHIGRAYGIDRGAVSRHGKRMRHHWTT